jgi:hypothetical protein
LTDNDIDREAWSPPKPVEHRQRTILSLAGTVILLAVLTFSLASVLCASAPT